MGIYGALATAVTGLRAQAFALESISGNIANSQTTGYKRIETDFVDLIPDAPLNRQLPGAVLSQSRGTNNVQGDIKTASSDTYLALNGSGFFIVEAKIGQNDGRAIFGGASYYTRRGDFDIDKEGFLVNGAGYYLKGLPIDGATGNISGSVPEVIQISNAFLPAQQTSRIEYRLNLPQLPKTASYEATTANSELLNIADFEVVPPNTTATATGAALTGGNAASTVVSNGQTLAVTVGVTTITYEFDTDGTNVPAGGNVEIDASGDINSILSAIQTHLRANGGAGAADATVGISGGAATITLGTNLTGSFTLANTTTGLGFTNGTYNFTDNSNVPMGNVSAAENDNFLTQSIAGGAITVYASNGSPVNVQMRWAKLDSAASGGVDKWNLFYLNDSTATGNNTMWTNSGVDFVFGPNGALNPGINATTLNGLAVNGVNIGNVVLQHNAGGVTQFSDANGTSQVTALSQNGYPAGEFISVTVNNSGRVVASYSNGQQVELAQVMVANFNAPNSLKRLDGGIFAATSESGEAILNTDGGIIGAALESSNTDISEEFTKLIVTQQAYAAGTRIVSVSNEMLQEALNMIR